MGKRLRLRRVPGGCLHLVLTLTNRHIKSQVVDKAGGVVVVSAATVESLVAERIFAQGNGPGDGERPPGWDDSYARASMRAARVVGQTLAEKARAIGITEVLWDGHDKKYVGKVRGEN
mmetsp:Transcript_8191/g.16547  ORF Transcript_8191/g.16547 Transcript_8191/m.16547 type:complete len:118 (-) Transcript_8191:2417-2770(-)